ncbi:MAG: AAA family ATPase [Elusimicrobia bacterium]|nr:AAA family ATPase [Elusimicrobiota bacterium]
MKLTRVIIKNFRSIETAEISFEPACRILVGINESGKTNILNALSLLNKKITPQDTDIRTPRHDEQTPVKEAYVRFVFSFDQTDIERIINQIQSKTIGIQPQTPILKLGDLGVSLKQIFENYNTAIYDVDLLSKTKTSRYWSFNKDYKLIEC